MQTDKDKILQKIAAYGAHPFWLGISSLTGNPPVNTNVTAINSLVQSACNTNGWQYIPNTILTQMMLDASWTTDYYADLTTSVHPNDAGHLLIAKLAMNLFYNPNFFGF